MGRDGGDDLMGWDMIYNSDGTHKGYDGDEERKLEEVKMVEEMIEDLESRIDEMKDEVRSLRGKLGIMSRESIVDKIMMKLMGLEDDVVDLGDDLKKEIEEEYDK